MFFYLSGILTMAWGIAHLFPVKNVVKNFGDITKDNQLIITMEWIIEGASLIFIGMLTILVTSIGPTLAVSGAVLLANAGMMVILSIISLLTGFRVKFLPYKLCPVIFLVSAILILLGLYIK